MGNGKVDTINILLVDDHLIYSEGVKSVINGYQNILYDGVKDGKNALKKIRGGAPDVILIGFNKPHNNGFGDMELILKSLPDAKILALSFNDNDGHILEVIRLGASGYILKDAHPDELVKAVNEVHNGNHYYSPAINGTILKEHALHVRKTKKPFIAAQLTKRETEVLLLIVDGCTNKQIAKKLGISVRTVETHREHITVKLNIKTVAQLTKYAITNGIIGLK